MTRPPGDEDPHGRQGPVCARSGCGNRLEISGRRGGRPAVYCSDSCRAAAHRARAAAHTPVVAEALRRAEALAAPLLRDRKSVV